MRWWRQIWWRPQKRRKITITERSCNLLARSNPAGLIGEREREREREGANWATYAPTANCMLHYRTHRRPASREFHRRSSGLSPMDIEGPHRARSSTCMESSETSKLARHHKLISCSCIAIAIAIEIAIPLLLLSSSLLPAISLLKLKLLLLLVASSCYYSTTVISFPSR